MARFAIRHLTAILILAAVAAWAIFYLPGTPSWAIFQLKQAVDARDGAGAARFVDFQKVVINAGDEMVSDQSGSGNVVTEFLGKGAVQLFSGPMAALLESWAEKKVDDGARQVQMPALAVAGAILMLHRDGDSAYTRWQDNKGKVWEVRMAHEQGQWKIVQVKNVKQLLDRLQREQSKNPYGPPYVPAPPSAAATP
jgi:hypothetical protein